ncbi:MAG: hypothetical protein HY699_17865 [Deltaproteobacteria bacterium]|nr:hypothetical protein [Deltaproteobacteria bacterium]
MAKRRALEDTLAELHALRQAPLTTAALSALRQGLNSKISYVVAKAAEITGEAEIGQLTPELVAAFGRLMLEPAKSDPGCQAKAQIADALYRIGYEEADLFLRGIHHVQLEPVYGGRVDTAAGLRSACALGLVRMNYPDVLSELADLLADPEAPARLAAVRALAYSENQNAAPLLRLKAHVGDEDPQVIAECLGALLKVAAAAALPFVARQLDAGAVTTRESAALALGSSRLRAAFPILREWWQRIRERELRRTALLAIAMLRQDEALAFLLSLVAEAPGHTAREALAALGLYRHDDALRKRVLCAATQRTDVDLSATIAEVF